MSNNKILMMSSDYFKRNSVVNLNVDTELIHPFIIKSQNLNIERLLGSNLFNTILSEIGSGSVSARMKTLLEDYIQLALVDWTLYNSLPFLNYKLTNKSVVKKSSGNSESVDMSELAFLRQTIRDDAEYYSTRVVDFLCENETTYPEYANGNDDMDDIRPSNNTYFGGIYLK